MVAQCTTPAATMHHSTDDDAPSSAVKLHFLSGVRISSSKKARKAQETQSYQRFQCIGHTDFNTSGTNGSRSLSRVKAGTHSPSLKESHTAAYTAKHGAFRMGVVSLPSDCFTRFGNSAWPGFRTANLAAFGSWLDALPKNAESLRNSDALMRVAVPQASRPRWAA